MKRAVALLLALTVLASAELVWAHRAVGGSAEAVELYETVLFGERENAAGVEVYLPAECMDRLFWDSTVSIASENTVKTSFRLSRYGESMEEEYEPHANIRLDVSDNLSGDARAPGELLTLISDAASRAPAGEQYSESVCLRDYYEYMPMYVEVGRFSYPDAQQADGQELERQLGEIFKIPVPEDYQIRVSMEKSLSGEIISWSVEPEREELSAWLDCYSAETDYGIWFTAHLDTQSDELECAGADKLWLYPFSGDVAEPVCVMDLEPSETVMCLEADAHGRLLMPVNRDGTAYMHVMDADGDCAQTVKLMELSGDDWINRLYIYEDFVLALSAEKLFTLAELTDGGYRACLSGELYAPEGKYIYANNDMVLSWDGRRLAMASRLYGISYMSTREAVGFLLWVYDEAGLACCARYESSLCLPEAASWSMNTQCRAGIELYIG